MFKIGIKKEMMFFTRSFRMWGILITAAALAILSPLLMKLMGVMMGGVNLLTDEAVGTSLSVNIQSGAFSTEFDDIMSVFDDETLAPMGILSAFGDLTSTLLLVFMIVTMYSAGGELKKRSMIIPLNSGLSTKLYILPKFLVYPVAAAIFGFLGIMLSGVTTMLAFLGSYEMNITVLVLTALITAVYDAFIVTLYFTMGLCTAKAGISAVVIFGGSSILSVLFAAFGADKFHPFALKEMGQELLTGGELDITNLGGSIGVSLLLMLLCYFVTLFVISAKRIDNRGEEKIEI